MIHIVFWVFTLRLSLCVARLWSFWDHPVLERARSASY